jgi:hypothetical protein
MTFNNLCNGWQDHTRYADLSPQRLWIDDFSLRQCKNDFVAMMTMMTRREGADEEEAGAGGVLRPSGAGADNTEGTDEKNGDEVGETGDDGGVLRASGADADGLEKKK